jgi:hypothetical protein
MLGNSRELASTPPSIPFSLACMAALTRKADKLLRLRIRTGIELSYIDIDMGDLMKVILNWIN